MKSARVQIELYFKAQMKSLAAFPSCTIIKSRKNIQPVLRLFQPARLLDT